MRPEVKEKRRLWIFDFDGTLSNLVPERSEAKILPEARDLLNTLSNRPGHEVAVLSSRLLEDLIPRVGVPGLYLGGGSGTEWLLMDGTRTVAEEKLERLHKTRETVMGDINGLRALPGVDVEDKKWSVAVHVRRAMQDARATVRQRLGNLQEKSDIRLLRGPEVFEIQLLPEIDKLFGVKTLCRLVSFDNREGLIVYAGDDENDAVAMGWVIRQGGIALSIGRDPLVAGAKSVATPAEFVMEARKLAGLQSG